ncbi:MAG: glycosyltransferase [Burkholderiaceae bacterium]
MSATGGEPLRPQAVPAAPVRPEHGCADAAGAQMRSTRLHVVVLTTFFPSPRDPFRTPFLRNLVDALASDCDIDLVIPVPRRPQIGPWRDVVPVPASETHAGWTLLHPRYLAMPGLHWLSGLTYFAGVWRTLRALKRSHGRFVLHAHCAYPDVVGAALAARMLGIPLVATTHGSDINLSGRQRLLRPQIRAALRSAERVIAVSAPLARAVAELADLPASRIACIPCAGFSPAVFHPRSRDERAALRQVLGVAARSRVVLFVGHLVPVKALDVLLRAWALLLRDATAGASARLILIGEGAQRDALERLARQEGIVDRVEFLGPLLHPAVADWIAAADVLCLPSHAEGSPNVVVEALASGTPVVASRVGGIPDLVDDGVNGLLVPAADPAALAAALGAALDRDWDPARISSSIAHLTWSALGRRNHGVLADVAMETAHAGAR